MTIGLHCKYSGNKKELMSEINTATLHTLAVIYKYQRKLELSRQENLFPDVKSDFQILQTIFFREVQRSGNP